MRSHIEVYVQDTGMGITEEVIQKLMMEDIYYTTKGTDGEAGTGLGLMLCKEFLSKNGGRMHVQSEPVRAAYFPSHCRKGKI